MVLDNELREKIRRRVRRAYDGETVHRCTMKEGVVWYRISIPSMGPYGGPKIPIRKDKIGRIYVPREV